MKSYRPLLALSVVFVGTIAVLGVAIERQLAPPSYDAQKESACLAAPTDKCLAELKNECMLAGGIWKGRCNLPTKAKP